MISYICVSCYEREAEAENSKCSLCEEPEYNGPESIGELAIEQWVTGG
jgi:hypothetical protein